MSKDPVPYAINELDPDLGPGPLRDAVRIAYDAWLPKRVLYLHTGDEVIQEQYAGRLVVDVYCGRERVRQNPRGEIFGCGEVLAEVWGTTHGLLYVALLPKGRPAKWKARDNPGDGRKRGAATLVRDLLDFQASDHPPLRVRCPRHGDGLADREQAMAAATSRGAQLRPVPIGIALDSR